MKRGTIDHPKTKKLSRLLGVCLAQTVGHLEAFWHYTARYSIQGDVGKWTDEEISQGSLWEKDAQKFVHAMVESGWIDRDNEHRLLVHDWEEHADQSVKKTMNNQNLSFFKPTGWNGSIQPEVNIPPLPGKDRQGKERKEEECEKEKNFERFWEVYPKKKNKGDAEKAWTVLNPNEQLVGKIIQAIERATKSEEWLKDGGQFVPFPASWIRAKGWLDEYPLLVKHPVTGSMRLNPIYKGDPEAEARARQIVMSGGAP